jgi:hypothetical protein
MPSAMGAPAGGLSLLLFVSGSVDPNDLPAHSRVALGMQVQGAFASRGLWARTPFDADAPPTDEGEESAGHRPLDPEEITCVNLVLDIAHRSHRDVSLINVEGAGEQQSLVDRWVGPNTLLPLLVRLDGATLSGSQEFEPERVRRFISGP